LYQQEDLVMKLNKLWIAILALAGAGVAFLAGMAVYGWGRPFQGWMHGYGMMGGAPGWLFPFGGGFMGVMMLFPILIVIALVAGGVWLLANLTRPAGTPAPPFVTQAPAGRVCSHCGRAAQADWNTCPYCGGTLQA
jgi:hypothetical protein